MLIVAGGNSQPPAISDGPNNTNEKVLILVSVIVIKTLSWVEIYLFSNIELLYDYKIYHVQLNIKSMLLLLNMVRFNNNYQKKLAISVS